MASNEPSIVNNSDAVVAASAVTTHSTGRHRFRYLPLPFFRSYTSSTRAKPSAKTSYHYEPLDARESEVRLLTLLPGGTSAKLRVSLSIVPFQVQSPPKFEALSYVWGSTENPDFFIVGETGDVTIGVTQNLAVALRHLRYRHQPRTLWFDAICVNQKDLAERSQQVQLMGSIYGSAAQVIAWVGPKTHDSSLALTVLQAIGTSFEVDWISLTAKSATKDQETLSADSSTPTWQGALNKAQFYAIKSLVFRPYFRRLWVQQEIRLARDDTAVIACGLAQLSWAIFGRAIFVLEFDLIPQPIQISLSLSDISAYSGRLGEVSTLSSPLIDGTLFVHVQATSHCLCSDPRDRVFALLSMYERANPLFGDRLDIHPDYDAPVSQLYQEVTRQDIHTCRRLDALRACELRQDNPHSLPTWVPDLSRPRLARTTSTGNAAGFTTPDFEFCASNVLRVRGIPMCSLKTAQSFQFGERTQDSIIRLLRQMRPSLSLTNTYVTGCTYLDAYCDAFSCGEFVDRHMPPLPHQQHREASTHMLKMIWAAGATERDFANISNTMTKAQRTDFFTDILTFCDHRTLCTTDRGYIALAPPYARPGDRISVLLGCPCPMLLRPDGDRWRVVGQCYVPGLQAGEALAGPLPRGFREVRAYDGDHRPWLHRIHDILKERILTEDPRFDISEHPAVRSVVDYEEWDSEERAWKKSGGEIETDDDWDRLSYPW